MVNTLRRITKVCCIAMIVIAAYSAVIPILIWRFDIFEMPARDHFIFYNDLLMLTVGIIALKLGEKLAKAKWFIKLSLVQAIASVTCVTLIYIPKKMIGGVGLYDIAYILSAALSVTVFVCCVIARRQLKKEEV